MRLNLLFFLLTVTLGSLSFETQADESVPWICYYDNKAKVEEFDSYKLCVFDSIDYPPLLPLKQKNKILLGYISLGEVETHRPYFKEVKEDGILLQENSDWPGSYYVDVRKSQWAKRVIEEIIPIILHKGFDGIFIDTLDNTEFLEEKDAEKFKGMKQAAINLVKAIRHNYPNIKIMMNRGFKVLEELASIVDIELGESIYTHYDFSRKTYHLQSQQDQEFYVDALKKAKQRNPHLQIYTLDYWDKDQPQKIKEIYKRQRGYGFSPYVGTIKLNEIIPEPKELHDKAPS